jgi:hypothetical protein
LSGLGTTVTGFSSIVEDAHAHWSLTGTISGTGVVEIGEAARLTLNGPVSIRFIAFGAGGDERLALENPTQVTSTFSGFGSGDIIVLSDILATSPQYSNGTLTLFDANHNIVDTLAISGDYDAADFALQPHGNGTEIVYAGEDEFALGVSDGGSAWNRFADTNAMPPIEIWQQRIGL